MEIGKLFATPDELREAVKSYAETRNFKAISRGIDKMKKRWIFICYKGSHYKSQTSTQVSQSSIRKKCPFRLRFYMNGEGAWRTVSMVEEHNHPLDKPLKKPLTPEELEILKEQCLRGMKPKDQLICVLKNDTNRGLSIKDIYNANSKIRRLLKITQEEKKPIDALPPIPWTSQADEKKCLEEPAPSSALTEEGECKDATGIKPELPAPESKTPKSASRHCGRCRQKGHNVKTCIDEVCE